MNPYNEGTHAERVAAALSMSTQQRESSSDAYARVFGLSLAALFATCLVLNAASTSTRTRQKPDRGRQTCTTSMSSSTCAVTASGGCRQAPGFGTMYSERCGADQGGDEALSAFLEKRRPYFTPEGQDHPLE
jgi:hypothetical protein